MNNLMIFQERQVLGKDFKIYGTKENPLFLAKDVAEWIDYEVSNVSKMVKRVDEDEKIITRTNNTSATFLTEDGLYEVLMQSRKPIAKQFKKEVKKILKQIRTTGGAVKDEEEFIKNYFPSFSEEVKQAMVLDLKHQNEKIQKELEEKNRFLNQISASSNSILVRDVAHLATKQNIKIGEKRLWNKLREWGLIQKGSTKPMQRALEQGLFEKAEFVIQRSHGVETKFTTRVTGKGQVYIIERLLKECA
ncbi:phage antirepressor KilAC domain-containing protein [Clostridium perfringens]|uniref:phage antirepressor n=1 Tax=Clostridium perfringens TaxID=1502 RepID=UPI000D71061B|nr:phage antirepressor KilAC domain-containing protein [Clostridium perfringens]ELC8418757.1 phage antirepressor KilAC domain-containing protein [Clostridium perfringens]MDK0740575.1 phage antirepressor KilAC domain-containing protein [Clostridium perfringens]MDK0984556.1 phage antirepressor KilAC domain-containing protein [Clostridium perfringens]MDM0628729.1 phage antirepressor KilAC domain-containing protein [Clostridium perfringens]MDM0890515.1 phage antirepressor KilAC domain-containing p